MPTKVDKGSKDSKSSFSRSVPVLVDSTSRVYLADGNAALEGHFAKVTGGEHEGRYGVFDSVASVDKEGWPKTVVFVTRDEDASTLVVNYSDLEADVAGHR